MSNTNNKFKISSTARETHLNQKNKITSEQISRTESDIAFSLTKNNNDNIIFDTLNELDIDYKICQVVFQEPVNLEHETTNEILNEIIEYHGNTLISEETEIKTATNETDLLPHIQEMYFIDSENNISFFTYINNEFKLLQKKFNAKIGLDEESENNKDGIWITVYEAFDEAQIIDGTLIRDDTSVTLNSIIKIAIYGTSGLEEELKDKLFLISRGIPIPLIYKGKSTYGMPIFESDFLKDTREYLNLIENIVSLYDFRKIAGNTRLAIRLFKITNVTNSFDNKINYFNYTEFE